jgi:hypothetical protein
MKIVNYGRKKFYNIFPRRWKTDWGQQQQQEQQDVVSKMMKTGGQKSFFWNDESIGFGPLTIGTAPQPMATY